MRAHTKAMVVKINNYIKQQKCAVRRYLSPTWVHKSSQERNQCPINGAQVEAGGNPHLAPGGGV